ncbi:MAG: hypothetical protein ACTSXO_09860 [Candidatus Heimdallarchaeota archaeon]
MNIEIGVEGASFQENLIFGSIQIKIPTASIPVLSKGETKTIQVVVNASTAASTAKAVNLTVRHYNTNGLLWEETKSAEIQIGQIIRTNVITTDEWTDWEELAPAIPTQGFSGYEIPTTFSIVFVFTILTIVTHRKKKKLKRYPKRFFFLLKTIIVVAMMDKKTVVKKKPTEGTSEPFSRIC